MPSPGNTSFCPRMAMPIKSGCDAVFIRPQNRPCSSPQGDRCPVFEAGLVRSLRGKPSTNARADRFERAAPEDLLARRRLPSRAANGVEWLPVPGWEFPWLWSGFSTRKGGLSRAYCAEDAPGELNLGFTAADDRETVSATAVCWPRPSPAMPQRRSSPCASSIPISSSRATAADAARKRPRKADGQMTDEPGLLLAIQTADCIPVLVADRKRRAVAAFHAGWRGTVKRIVETGIGRMRLAFGSRPEDLSPPSVPASAPAVTPSARRCFRSSNRNSPMRANCFARSTMRTRCGRSIPCCF